MPTYRVWYSRLTPGWGGSVRGPVMTIEAPDEEAAKDEYILQTEPAVWRRHWDGWEDGLQEDDVYNDWLEHLELVVLPPPLRVVRGGRDGRPLEGEPGRLEDHRASGDA